MLPVESRTNRLESIFVFGETSVNSDMSKVKQ